MPLKRRAEDSAVSKVTLVSTSYGEVAVHDFGGSESGDSVLFLPANGFHGYCYRPVALILRDSLHCYALDLPGQGRSSVAPSDKNLFEYYVEAIAAVLKSCKLKGCCAFGHSSGGLAAILMQLHDATSFSSVILYEAVIHPPDKPWNDPDGTCSTGRWASKRRAEFPSKAHALANFASKPPFQTFLTDALHCYVLHGLEELADGTAHLRCTPQAEFRGYNAVDEACQVAWPGLRSLSLPVTVAHGGEGKSPAFSGPEAASPPIAAMIPGSRRERYCHLGHFGPMEDPFFIGARIAAHCKAAGNPAVWDNLPRQANYDLSRL